MKKFKFALGIAGTVVLCYVIIMVSFFAIFAATTEDKYAKSSGWSLKENEFAETYYDLYNTKLEELKDKYDISCNSEVEKLGEESDLFVFYLYNNEYTVQIILQDNSVYGRFEIALYYYETEGNSLADYECQRSLVNFINEFTHYVAFDTKSDECENHFEKMYFENAQKGEGKHNSSYFYHSDNLVRDVGYSVYLMSDRCSYYHNMLKNNELETTANVFEFKGLLKPIIQ